MARSCRSTGIFSSTLVTTVFQKKIEFLLGEDIKEFSGAHIPKYFGGATSSAGLGGILITGCMTCGGGRSEMAFSNSSLAISWL